MRNLAYYFVPETVVHLEGVGQLAVVLSAGPVRNGQVLGPLVQDVGPRNRVPFRPALQSPLLPTVGPRPSPVGLLEAKPHVLADRRVKVFEQLSKKIFSCQDLVYIV